VKPIKLQGVKMIVDNKKTYSSGNWIIQAPTMTSDFVNHSILLEEHKLH